MSHNFHYAYLVGNLLILFPIWLFLFLYRKDLRREMLTMSFILGICGPISELWYLQDYWRPETFTGSRIGLEDFLFGFLIGGIASVIYLELFNKHIGKYKDNKHHWRLLFLFIAIFTLVFNGLFLLGINSIYASIIVLLILALFIFFIRRDLFIDGLMSGIFLGVMMLIAYSIFLFIFPGIISKWWFLHNISGILILGIPIEELVWAFSLGLVAGPVYEFITGLKLKSSKN